MQDFTKLKVWQKAHDLRIDVRRAVDEGPAKWNYPDLRSQTLRAAASISRNIAEGCGKPSSLELARYADVSAGSAKERMDALMLARDLFYLTAKEFADFERRLNEITRMLRALAAAVRRKRPPDVS